MEGGDLVLPSSLDP